jgi:glutamate dehydrogenase (NAD(P)+)
VAVQDHTGSIGHAKRIDSDALAAYVEETGGIAGYAEADVLSDEEFWKTKVDICIPGALEWQITEENAPWLDCRLVAEAANGPMTPGAEKILTENGIDVIPDILCNSGGVIVSFFEWTQNRRGETWYLDEVRHKLKRRIADAYDRTTRAMNKYECHRRDGAMIVALDRIAQAYEERGLFP